MLFPVVLKLVEWHLNEAFPRRRDTGVTCTGHRPPQVLHPSFQRLRYLVNLPRRIVEGRLCLHPFLAYKVNEFHEITTFHEHLSLLFSRFVHVRHHLADMMKDE